MNPGATVLNDNDSAKSLNETVTFKFEICATADPERAVNVYETSLQVLCIIIYALQTFK